MNSNFNYSKNNLLKNVKPSWLNILDNNVLDEIINNLNNKSEVILPFKENIFRIFTFFEL